ncbi:MULTISPECIES: hypothetical protein [unclassified Acidovorax]|uniref:hypothetical protein n=1 Tax=unclassified Acidovorax TaxID=2684926 RepID=UPI00023FD334|nr:hypothetical protein [Acidovorax sp. NO-1]EHL21618.1 hypothetical protein KYG_16542 [Acidovorax sp. NO-1]
MEELFALIVAPAVLVGVVGAVALAVLFHLLAPAGTDTVSAGAWLVGIGAVGGLLWEWRFRADKKK